MLRYLSIRGNACKNMAIRSHNHEHVRGGVNKAFLGYLILWDTPELCMSSKRLWSDFIIVLRQGCRDGIDYVMYANRTELTATMNSRKIGGGGEQLHLVMSKEPEMPGIIYFHSISCLCSLFSLSKLMLLLKMLWRSDVVL